MLVEDSIGRQLTWTQLMLISIGGFAIYYVTTAIYNLFFSPLAKVPGPFFSRFSGLPSFYHALKGDRHIWIWQNLQIYGRKCRIYPNGVVFKSPEAFRDIYSTKSNVARSKMYTIWQRNEDDVNTVNTLDPVIHARKRRILNGVFTEKTIRAAGVFINQHIDRWIDLIAEGGDSDWSSPRDITKWSDWLVFDILGELCFGRSFEIKEPNENPLRTIPEAINAYMNFVYPLIRSPALSTFVWLKPRGLDKILDVITPPLIKSYYNFIEESVAARKKAEEDNDKKPDGEKNSRLDMFHFLFQAKDPETGGPAYTDQELLAEANLLIVAGSHTTSINLCGFFFYMTRNPRVYEKLVKELRTTFSDISEIAHGPKLSSCYYLRACLDESMRLTPAVPAEISRVVLAGGQIVDGDYYPPGVIVGTSGWSSGRDEEFGDPFVYRPERWIPNKEAGVTPEEVSRIRQLVNPFIIGTTNCVGQNLAMLEMLCTIARTLYRMDIRAALGSTIGEGNPANGWGERDRGLFQITDAYVSMRN